MSGSRTRPWRKGTTCQHDLTVGQWLVALAHVDDQGAAGPLDEQEPAGAGAHGGLVAAGEPAVREEPASQVETCSAQRQDRARIALLGGDRQGGPVRRAAGAGHGEPGRHVSRRREPVGARRLRGPGQRDPGAVAADAAAGPHRIHPGLQRDVDLGQAELLALVEVRRRRADPAAPPARRGPGRSRRSPPPKRVADRTMSWFSSAHVGVAPCSRACGSSSFPAAAHARPASQAQLHEREREGLLHLVGAGVAGGAGRFQVDLAHQQPRAARVLLGQAAPAAVDLVHLLLVPACGLDRSPSHDAAGVGEVGQTVGLEQAVRHVDAQRRPRPCRTRTAARRRSSRRRPGAASSSPAARERRGAGTTRRAGRRPPVDPGPGGAAEDAGPVVRRQLARCAAARRGSGSTTAPALPGPAARAARNSGCSDEQWLGTRSTMTRSPSPWAVDTRASKSPSVPNSGSTSQ